MASNEGEKANVGKSESKAGLLDAGEQDGQFVDISLSPRGDHLELPAPLASAHLGNSSDTIEPIGETEEDKPANQAEQPPITQGAQENVPKLAEGAEGGNAVTTSSSAVQNVDQVTLEKPVDQEEDSPTQEIVQSEVEEGTDTTETATTSKPKNEETAVEPPKELAPNMHKHQGHHGKKKRKKHKKGKGKGKAGAA